MTKQTFRKHIVFSSILTVIAIVVIVGFCAIMFKRYSPPSENNTSLINGTVTEVYHAVPKGEIVVAMSNGDLLKLVYPMGIRNLYSTIGYDVVQLADLLEGEIIECRRMDHLPWAVEIYVGDTKIDNNKLTTQQVVVTRVAIVILGLIMIAFPISGDVIYLKSKYKCYLKEKKKQERKAKRELKKSQK